MGMGISCPHATPRFFALIQMTSDCNMVRKRSLPASEEPIALVYLSANSHATTKSIQSVPNTERSCACKLDAFLNGTMFKIYGKSTLSGRIPGRGPQIVIILHPSFKLENLGIIFSI